MSTWPSSIRQWPSRNIENRPEALGWTCRELERRAKDGRDVPRTGVTCRGQERRAEDGSDVPRTGVTCRGRERRAEDGREVA